MTKEKLPVERPLDTKTLDLAARHYAAKFIANEGRQNRDWVMKQFYNFTYKDEFLYMVEAIRKHLGPEALADFDARRAQLPPRSNEVFLRLLEEKRPAGYTPKGE